MRNRRSGFLGVIAVAAMLGACNSGSGIQTGQVTGKVYVGQQSYALKHAYAYAPSGENELWVYLVDAPLEPGAIKDRFGVHEPAAAGKVHGVKLTLDPTNKAPTELKAVLLMPPAPGETLSSISVSGSEAVFESLTLEPAKTAGRIRRDLKGAFDAPHYGFEADFTIATAP